GKRTCRTYRCEEELAASVPGTRSAGVHARDLLAVALHATLLLSAGRLGWRAAPGRAPRSSRTPPKALRVGETGSWVPHRISGVNRAALSSAAALQQRGGVELVRGGLVGNVDYLDG